MKRLLLAATLLIAILVGLLGYRLRQQSGALLAPAGGSGVIEGTAYDLSSLLSARVEQVSAKKGDRVKAGQVLLSLDCADVDAAVGEAEARVLAARAGIEAAKAGRTAAARATGAAEAQVAASRSRGQALEARRAAASRNARRLEGLGNAISPATVDDATAESDSLALERRAADDTTRATAAQATVSEAQTRAADAQVASAEASLRLAEASSQRAMLLRRECRIAAPVDGFVEDVYVEVGETPQRGVPLVRVVDIHEVKATFYLPNAELGAVQTGAVATIIADGFPDRAISGTVTSVAFEAAFTPRNIQTRTDRDRLVFPVEVVIPNPDLHLRPGMPVEVRIPRAQKASGK